MRSPGFWQRDGLVPWLLEPAGWLLAAAGRWRQRHTRPYRPTIPVICIGNLTAGGQGKTPTALALADYLHSLGANPWFVSRGYGGREAGPLRVDPNRHGAAEVGDEPLLLARTAPAVIARQRPLGAVMAQEGGADLLILDDGFQNPSLAKDLSLIVIDGGFGFGNGRLLPAGPLREPIQEGLARAQAVVLIGADHTGVRARLPAGLPVLTADLVPDPTVAASLTGQRLFAFAGIGRPEKFFESLRKCGGRLVGTEAYPDHYPYPPETLARLDSAARAADATLITTEKDAVRLPPDFRARILTLPVRLRFADLPALRGLVAPLVRR